MQSPIARLLGGATLVLVLVACPTLPPARVLSVTIVGGDRTIAQGATVTLDADVEATGGASDTVTWTSSNGDVASIDADGTVTGLTVGSTSVTATSTADPGKSDTITLTVDLSGSVISVTILGGDRTIVEGTSVTLAVVVDAEGGADETVAWSASDEDFVTVDADGTVTGLTAGSAEITATSVVDPSLSDSITVTVDPPGAHAWTRQFGTSSVDRARAVATDLSDNVYVTGFTEGGLEGTNAGESDGFIRTFDSDGNLRWTRQFGTSSSDYAFGVATDATGNVYAAGYTSGALDGANAGFADAFIRSYDGDGNLRWTRQFGTMSNDYAEAVTTDTNGNVYAAGSTLGALDGASAGLADAFIRSYDSDGTLRWTRQFGTSSDDYATAIAADASGNVYAAGHTSGALEGPNSGGVDAFIRSYDSDGTLRWTRQFGTSSGDYAYGVATDEDGSVYAAGATLGALVGASAGGSDAYIRSYDGDGTLRWTRQSGTSSSDYAHGVATDASGNVHATGWTLGTLDGDNAGAGDVFIRSYAGDGTHRWTRQFGTSNYDYAHGVATDAGANVYAAGHTFGALDGADEGNGDAFLRKHGP